MFSTHSQSTEELWLQLEVQHQVRIFYVSLKKRNLFFFPAIKYAILKTKTKTKREKKEREKKKMVSRDKQNFKLLRKKI